MKHDARHPGPMKWAGRIGETEGFARADLLHLEAQLAGGLAEMRVVTSACTRPMSSHRPARGSFLRAFSRMPDPDRCLCCSGSQTPCVEAPGTATRQNHLNAANRVVVLGFAHLPVDAGGRQTSGLSYAAYAIAEGLSKSTQELEYLLCCTDVKGSLRSPLELQSGVKVVGWSVLGLLAFFTLNPALSLWLALRAGEYCLRYRHERNPIRVFAKMLLFAAAIRHHHPDILHIHDAPRTLLLARIPGARRKLWVTTVHLVIGFDRNRPRSCRKIERDALRVGQHFVFVSEGTRNQLVSGYGWVPKHTATVITNGVDLARFVMLDRAKCRDRLHLPVDKIVFLTVGSLSARKGQERILASFAGLPEEVRSKLCCVFVGKEVSRLSAIVPAATLEVHAHEHVPAERLVEFYNAADYHLSASSSEGFGMVMTESLACGTPIVVPSTCDIVEEDVVMDGKNAIVYPAPTEEAIREAVLRAMEARFDRAAVRRTVAGMAWSSVSAVYEKLFGALARSSVSSACEGIRRHANL